MVCIELLDLTLDHNHIRNIGFPIFIHHSVLHLLPCLFLPLPLPLSTSTSICRSDDRPDPHGEGASAVPEGVHPGRGVQAGCSEKVRGHDIKPHHSNLTSDWPRPWIRKIVWMIILEDKEQIIQN